MMGAIRSSETALTSQKTAFFIDNMFIIRTYLVIKSAKNFPFDTKVEYALAL
jgi:hypothetical protein